MIDGSNVNDVGRRNLVTGDFKVTLMAHKRKSRVMPFPTFWQE
jgi:hypothetical protein